ncbi:MAG TPA: crossover junction endodeoxyribonuclease RuvC [Spirochaetia bacterium]|nr:crossover junction endodeoxyribonuclease RuvC [Spirochaetia bacterium]
MRTIIGIDPGLTSTGYGVIEVDGNRYRHISHGVIATLPSEDRSSRLLTIYLELEKIIREYSPGEAGVESLFFAKNVKTALPVAEARGVILMCLAMKKVSFCEYTPLQVKQAVLGQGRGEKRQVGQMIKLIFGLDEVPTPDHASDALAIALCHLNYSHLKRLQNEGR